jgi:hypothetical protein
MIDNRFEEFSSAAARELECKEQIALQREQDKKFFCSFVLSAYYCLLPPAYCLPDHSVRPR